MTSGRGASAVEMEGTVLHVSSACSSRLAVTYTPVDAMVQGTELEQSEFWEFVLFGQTRCETDESIIKTCIFA